MLLDVITAVATDIGLDLVGQRQTLVNLANRAAKQMFVRLECNKVFWEITLEVPPNKIIALPPYIGELRGMRCSITEMIFNAKPMNSPRYVRKDWSYRWRNWRDMGESAVMTFPSTVAPLAITAAVVEEDNPIEVVINGQTNNALRIEEKVILTSEAPSVITTNMFGPQMYTIACFNLNRVSDISIVDANGLLLAMLYNMDTFTRYKMIDVSEAPWSIDTSNNNTLVDVLYKVLMRQLSKDTDSFPANADYDGAWYWWMMYLYFKPMQNKPAEYETFFPNAIKEMAAVMEGTEGNLDKRLSFGRNKYYSLTKGIRVYPGAISTIDRAN